MKNVKWVVIGLIAFLGILLLLRFRCTPDKPPVVENNPVISVTPIADQAELEKLPELPNKEKPVYAVPVPTPKPVLGKKVTPSVVVSDKGNTFVVYSEAVDWGFRLEPKLSLGVSEDFLVGMDLTFFTYWKLNADALVYVPIREDLDLTMLKVGAGVSYKITHNTSAGVGYLKDFGNNNSFVGFVSLKF